MSRYYENDYRNDYDHDGYDSDSGCGCGCSERREFPRCGLRVLVKPGCYKCKELKNTSADGLLLNMNIDMLDNLAAEQSQFLM